MQHVIIVIEYEISTQSTDKFSPTVKNVLQQKNFDKFPFCWMKFVEMDIKKK